MVQFDRGVDRHAPRGTPVSVVCGFCNEAGNPASHTTELLYLRHFRLCFHQQRWNSSAFAEIHRGFAGIHRGFAEIHSGFVEVRRGFAEIHRRFAEIHRRFAGLGNANI